MSNKKRQYTKEAIDDAVKFVKNKVGSARLAAKLFEVPRSTIQFKIDNPETQFKSGPNPVLNDTEESALADFIISMAKRGFPRKKEDVKTCVQDFLKENPRPNPFNNDRPGDAWFNAFLKRHPNIAFRTSEGVTNASSCVSEQDIRKWFEEIHQYILEAGLTDVIQDPRRVFNADETGFNICPKTGKVLAEKGSKNVYEIEKAQAKENITVMFSFSAAGFACNPMTIYPYQRIPDRIAESVPEGWGIGRSDSGWMTAAVFYEYIANVFHAQLVANNIQFPVILFVDGHKTHLTLEVSELCKKLQIHLIALYPNATRILQPADVAAFRPIKSGWKKALRDWYTESNYETALTKLTFAPLLKKVLSSTTKESTLVHGFRVTGLFPFDEDNVDYSKCLGSKKKEQVYETVVENVDTSYAMTYSDFCDVVGQKIVAQCQTVTPTRLHCDNDYFKAIFNIWKRFQESRTFIAKEDLERLNTYGVDAIKSPSILRQIEEGQNENFLLDEATTCDFVSLECQKWEDNRILQDNDIEEKTSHSLDLGFDTVLDETTGEFKSPSCNKDVVEMDSQSLELRYDLTKEITEELNSQNSKKHIVEVDLPSLKLTKDITNETTWELKGRETNITLDEIKKSTDLHSQDKQMNEVTKTELPTTSFPVALDSQKSFTRASKSNDSGNKISILSEESLSEYLKRHKWPQSPKRKGKREIERQPYALTSDPFIANMKIKQLKKKQEQAEKENRKRLREEKKIEKEKSKITKKKDTSTNDSKMKIKVNKTKIETNVKDKKARIETITSQQLGNDNDERVLTPTVTKNISGVPSPMCYACTGEITKKVLECDECQKQFHKNCVPTFHRHHIPLDEDDEYLCHVCYRESNTDSSDSADYMYKSIRKEASTQGFR